MRGFVDGIIADILDVILGGILCKGLWKGSWRKMLIMLRDCNISTIEPYDHPQPVGCGGVECWILANSCTQEVTKSTISIELSLAKPSKPSRKILDLSSHQPWI